MTVEEREALRADNLAFKDCSENEKRGRYGRIYPLSEKSISEDESRAELQSNYDYLIACSKEVWGEQM